jgi:hypothetical protein
MGFVILTARNDGQVRFRLGGIARDEGALHPDLCARRQRPNEDLRQSIERSVVGRTVGTYPNDDAVQKFEPFTLEGTGRYEPVVFESTERPRSLRGDLSRIEHKIECRRDGDARPSR